MSYISTSSIIVNPADKVKYVTKTTTPSFRPHSFPTFQNFCCEINSIGKSPSENKSILPIPSEFKNRGKKLLEIINGHLIETLTILNSYTSSIPPEFFEKVDGTIIEKYFVDLSLIRTLNEKRIINWHSKLMWLHPIRTSGNGNCLLHAVLIALIGVHDFNLYLRDRLLYFMNDNQEILKSYWKKQRLSSDKTYGIDTDDTKLDAEWKEVCDLVRYENTEDGQAATNLHFLEAIHIFSVSNLLQRPIIVLSDDVVRNLDGEAIAYNDVYGIYLPLLVPVEECCREPIVLVYHQFHFSPLQPSREEVQKKTFDALLPLYRTVNDVYDDVLLPIRFNDSDVKKQKTEYLLKKYLHVREIPYSYDTRYSTLNLLCAELGTRLTDKKDDFFYLYYDYCRDFFLKRLPDAIAEEREQQRKRLFDQAVTNNTPPDMTGRAIATNQATPMVISGLNSEDHVVTTTQSYNQHSSLDDPTNPSKDQYLPKDNPTGDESIKPKPSNMSSMNNQASDHRAPGNTTSPLRLQDATSSDFLHTPKGISIPVRVITDNITNLDPTEKRMNTIDKTKPQMNGGTTLGTQRHEPAGTRFSSAPLKPSTNYFIGFDQQRDINDICVLCDGPLYGASFTSICARCARCDPRRDYRPSDYTISAGRPSTSLHANTLVTTPRPKSARTTSGRLKCPSCGMPNLYGSGSYNADFNCSSCRRSFNLDRYYK